MIHHCSPSDRARHGHGTARVAIPSWQSAMGWVGRERCVTLGGMTLARADKEPGTVAIFGHAGHAVDSPVVPTGIPGVPAARICCVERHPVVIDGELLREAWADPSLSRERLARAAGISMTTISRLERESRPGCHLGTCNKIAAALGLDVREIIVRGSNWPGDTAARRRGAARWV